MIWQFVTWAGLIVGNVQQDSTANPGFADQLNRVYRHTVPTVTVSELKAMMKQGIVILDAREQEEYEVSHMRHAQHVGYVWFDMRKIYNIPKTDTIVVYCAIGNRGERIGEKLRKAGYQHVYNLFGGIYEWVNQRNPVYNRNNVQTTKIHIYEPSWSKWLEYGTRIH
ncbi:rhodanese-like domain-containing protein [Parapedobacter sp. ISTM3]|uniref:Rhodanese-related sulfurtransferase n=1 Tax=Parapedobacter luteus TaxID=623280 RepID=A0A1T5B1Q7_9SPHI|nr:MULTISPECIES: rhodanese-like domain-containing protein [Parapedobacter]MBK1440443.1 rhodanese-like domain-containing protein [Parapedobacter sp. ISTM3]SKB41144.1 Rhodanese-related sulfurtransferase [Parapedobacter luteus]